MGESRVRESETCPGLAARIAAAAILSDIIARCHPLDECFSGTAILSRIGGLDVRDIALARSIVTVALRRLGTIQAALAGLLEKGLPRQAAHLEWSLIAAAAQILFLDVPDHAAVDLAVRMSRLEAKGAPFASLVNGVLRNLIRAREKILRESDPLNHDTPEWLAERWRQTYGESGAHAIATAHREEPTLDLTVLTDPSIWAEQLGANVLPTGSLRLRTHMPVTGLPGFAEGCWFVQDAAAALPARLLRAGPGIRVADFCAAPGGKAAQLAASGAEVTAIDRSAERLKKLAANFARLNLRASIAVADIVDFKTAPFDAILVDAPCLATGTIRRHPDIAWIKKPRDLVALTALQTRLLDKAVELVKPGGMIVYCTCSLEPEENEMQIAALL
ncbi:MAG: RsmB/NOP family class I SAM-dependent RNA methyltransferase, partial [Methylocella sp.]